MSKILCCITFILITLPLFAQYNFDFSCTNDTFQVVNPWEVATYYFRLENTGTEQDVYELTCTIVEDVPGWDVTWCVGSG
ncbi:unnamed protein product [marine sediment metagenome]|uniref:Uncharacterized protein n=1 Tax=marine sediment metagenome TaxID=412755 RepID=X1CPG2_9ZZZZ